MVILWNNLTCFFRTLLHNSSSGYGTVRYLPQELLLQEHVRHALIARLGEQQAVHERAGHLAPSALQLHHAVLHLGGDHAHPLRRQLGLVEEAAHPAHRRGVPARHRLQLQHGRLAIAAGVEALPLKQMLWIQI